MRPAPLFNETDRCTQCSEYPDTSDEMLEIEKTGDLVCMACQLDACSNFGQDIDNLTKSMLVNIVIRFINENS